MVIKGIFGCSQQNIELSIHKYPVDFQGNSESE